MTLRWLDLRDPDGACEIFTPPALIQKIFDMSSPESFLPGVAFLEPCCGNGNFLVEVVAYKLRAGCTPLEAVKDIYAVELMADNVLVSRHRTLKAAGLLGNRQAEEIVEKQIRQGNFLKDNVGADEYWETAQPIRFEDLKDTIEANIPYLKEMGAPPFEVLRSTRKRRRRRA